MLKAGQQLGQYLIVGRIGESRLADVYRVRNTNLGTPAALKVVDDGPGRREALVQVVRQQSAVHHPNLSPFTDVLELDGKLGLITELIDGPTLELWLASYQPTLDEALALFRGIVCGVGHAHAHGQLHGNLKPGNVMLALGDDWTIPKVTDLGLARALGTGPTQQSQRGGSPNYAAPEQLQHPEGVDRRADLWSLGCILYRMTCGLPPFAGDDIMELFSEISRGDYVSSRELRPGMPEFLHEAIEALLQVDHKRRASDCAELVTFLDGVSGLQELTIIVGTELPEAKSPTTTQLTGLPAGSSGVEHARSQREDSMRLLPKLERQAPAEGLLELDEPVALAAPGEPSGRRVRPTALDLPQPAPLAPQAPLGDTQTGDHTEVPGPRRTRLQRAAVWAMGLIAVGIGTVMIVAALGAAFLIVSVGQYLEDSPIAVFEAIEPPGLKPSDPQPTSAEPQPTSAEPQPTSAEPQPTSAEPQPAPQPDPTAPRPAPPRSRPDAPAPEPQPTEPTPSPATTQSASVAFTGAHALWLEDASSGSELRDLGTIPPGTYIVRATFEAGEPPIAAGRITLAAGQQLALRCVADFSQCRSRP